MIAERFHHPYGPSKLQFLEACPAYDSAQGNSAAAETGTRQHTVAETGADDLSLSDEEAAAAAAAMSFVASHKELLKEEAQLSGGEVLDLREVYLPIDNEETTGGTADQILISGDRKRAIMVDFKYGRWAVAEARTNIQGIAYALSIFHAYPTVASVAVHFFQPAVATENNATFYRADVPELLLRIKTIVARAKAAKF